MTSTQTLIEQEKQYVLQTYRRPPFVLDHGEGVYLYDTEGHKYLDFTAGIAVNALGYGDKDVLATVDAQSHKLMHTSNLYYTAPMIRLAKKLVENSFADKVFFCNSGTEANEGALKFARKWARRNFGEGKTGLVAFSHSFHGRTFGALALTAKERYRAPFEPLLPNVQFAEFNDLASAQAVIGDGTCAVMVEPIQGEGGVNIATTEFLQGLRAHCDAHNVVLIFDEIQCGLARTGKLWAYQMHGVTPDIMTLAKPLGGGLPIGAILLTDKIASAMEPGDHGSTFAANATICAVAEVVFDKLSDEKFLAHVGEQGAYLNEKLEALKAEFPMLIREVRGRGLIMGVDLTVDSGKAVNKGYEHGLILVNAGENTIRLVPPLVVEAKHIDEFADKFGAVLSELGQDGHQV
ncbi:MAG: aspartate aminotransferase family protein [Chloroflexi bacterium]|nr:aspartate aminotransferase family protein [Chloroflexota bacterium]